MYESIDIVIITQNFLLFYIKYKTQYKTEEKFLLHWKGSAWKSNYIIIRREIQDNIHFYIHIPNIPNILKWMYGCLYLYSIWPGQIFQIFQKSHHIARFSNFSLATDCRWTLISWLSFKCSLRSRNNAKKKLIETETVDFLFF